MELLLTQKLLIDGLKLFQVSQGKAMVVMMLMDTEEKRWRMMKFMQDNLSATEEKLVAEAYRIAAM